MNSSISDVGIQLHLSPTDFNLHIFSTPHMYYVIMNLQYILSFTTDRVVDCGSTVFKALCYEIGRSLVRFQLVSVDFSLT